MWMAQLLKTALRLAVSGKYGRLACTCLWIRLCLNGSKQKVNSILLSTVFIDTLESISFGPAEVFIDTLKVVS